MRGATYSFDVNRHPTTGKRRVQLLHHGRVVRENLPNMTLKVADTYHRGLNILDRLSLELP